MEGSQSDFANYLRLADLLVSGEIGVDSVNAWLLVTWPPGMGVTYSAIHLLTWGTSAFSLTYLVLVVAVWSLLLWLPVLLARSLRTALVSLTLGTFVALSPPFQDWLLGAGIFYSESLSIAFFVASQVLYLAAFSSYVSDCARLWIALISGGAMGVAAYYRSVFDLVGLTVSAIFLVFIGAILLLKFGHFVKPNQAVPLKLMSRPSKRLLQACLLWVVAFTIVTQPWRVAVNRLIAQGATTFAPGGQRAWVNGWLPSERLPDWAVDVGMNGFCTAYPEDCRRIENLENSTAAPYSGSGALTPGEFRDSAMQSISADPQPWIDDRVNLAVRQSLAALGGNSLSFVLLFASLAMMAASCLLIVRNFATAHSLERLSMAIFLCVAWIVPVLPLFMSSMEPRYFFPSLISSWVIFSYVIVFSRRAGSTQNPSFRSVEA